MVGGSLWRLNDRTSKASLGRHRALIGVLSVVVTVVPWFAGAREVVDGRREGGRRSGEDGARG